MSVTLDHLTKHLAGKLKKGNYGSVLIHLRDGEVTGVKDNIEYNPASFVEHVEKPITRYVVRNKKLLESEEKTEPEQIAEKTEQIAEVVDINEK